jgi:hypothetical protein
MGHPIFPNDEFFLTAIHFDLADPRTSRLEECLALWQYYFDFGYISRAVCPIHHYFYHTPYWYLFHSFYIPWAQNAKQ